ncbi:MAG: 4-alpha-glucanotransferase [Ilumatobacteraceae bacterium]|nr:4-alpha-glucanotransferase [Ilumatobacteraceae bacterium]
MTVHDEWSISDGYYDVGGTWHATQDETRAALREVMGTPADGPPIWFVPVGTAPSLWNPCAIELEDGGRIGPLTALPADLPIGYHDLVPLDGGPTTRLIVHPDACPEIPDTWGLACQLYALWSDRSWGIGDLGDLRDLARQLGDAGGAAILVSPLHQPAPSLPQQDSPYYPSSRRAWNPLLLAIDAEPPADLACRADTLVDRDAVWAAKRSVLEGRFRASAAGRDPADHDSAGGPGRVACWNALCDELGPQWRAWPEPWSRFDADDVAERLHTDASFAERAAFHEWCQGEIAGQLVALDDMEVGIIGDLAVGFSPDGADACEFQALLALDVRIGAPPDPFSTDGQEWGIPPFTPWRLRNARYQPFIDTIRATLRGVHGLRIDHVMGLFRQFWIPAGSRPADGAYVQFPSDDLIAIIAIEATRAGAYVVGEDLGTVEPGVRERLAAANIAGTRVLWFEEEPPSAWPAMCLASVTTHDLPTVTGVFDGTDGDDEQQQRLAAVSEATSAAEVIDDVHASLLGAPPRLRLLAMDDLCGASERPNHPGTVDRLNWRRRLPHSVDDIELPRLADDPTTDRTGRPL